MYHYDVLTEGNVSFVVLLIYPMPLLETSNQTDGSAASNQTGWVLSMADEVRHR